MHEVFVPAESTIKICFKATRRLQSCENLHFLPLHLMCHPQAWCRIDHECSTIFSKCKRAELQVLFEPKKCNIFFLRMCTKNGKIRNVCHWKAETCLSVQF